MLDFSEHPYCSEPMLAELDAILDVVPDFLIGLSITMSLLGASDNPSLFIIIFFIYVFYLLEAAEIY